MSILSRWWRVASLATLTFLASAPAAFAQSTTEAGEALVSTEWLEKNLRNAKVRVIEVSVNPGLYERGHIRARSTSRGTTTSTTACAATS